MERLSKCWVGMVVLLVSSGWGFFAHQKINRLAVFILPPEMIGFYKKNIQYITETAVNPDRRRYTVPQEAPRHYIDLDRYEKKTGMDSFPRTWSSAVKKWGEDTLRVNGIVVWHITRMYFELRKAFLLRDPKKILRLSAELGHYVADAHVPLHTTSNYDGQQTNQRGIHAFWESRLPELYLPEYDFFVGRAAYIADVQSDAWKAVRDSHAALDSVLSFEQEVFNKDGEAKFTFETKGKKTIKVIAHGYARKYHQRLHGMVERRMRASIKMTGDLWFTAWVNAGQPDLKLLIGYTPSENELAERKKELDSLKERNITTREHEVGE